jgi:uncharacterized protein DUF4440
MRLKPGARTRTVVLFQCLLTTRLLGAQAPATDSSQIAAVIALQHAIATALVRGDEAFLDRTYAPEYIYVSPAGEVRAKKEVLAGRRAGAFRTLSLKYDELRVHLYGPVAVVIGRALAETLERGRRSGGQSRFVRVQVLRGGRWQVVYYQVTHIAAD